MLKRALRVLRLAFAMPSLLLLAIPAPGFAAGTIAYSLSQQLNSAGQPLSGCMLYTYQAGTTATPQNAYKDYGLTQVQPNPMICDASGRLPQFFLADGYIKITLADKNGITQVTADNILVIGPSSGGGSGATIDPTTIASTGDLKVAYGTQVITGWVRMNGRTIGSATSGATERANSDTQALFQYLWSADPNLAVSGGRGASSAADWAANKTIALPDARGRGVAGLDDMGNAAAGRLTATYFGASGGCSGVLGTTLGAGCGGESQTLTIAQMPAHQHNIYLHDPGHSHAIPQIANTGNASIVAAGSVSAEPDATTRIATTGITIGSVNGVANDNLTAAQGSGSAHPTVPPMILATYYIKL